MLLHRYCILIVIVLVVLSAFGGGFACRETPPQPRLSQVSLTAEDVGVTDAYLHLQASLTHGPWTITLKRDTTEIFRTPETSLVSFDTLILDDELLPNHSYTYRAFYLIGNVAVDSSEPLLVSTLDSTSHSFSFQIDTLGDGNSSVLYDVAIISDTLAYAVGEIYKRDNLGNWDPNAYNLAKWDGKRWELMRIQFYTFCGQSGTGSYPAKSIFALSDSEVFISDGAQLTSWNGHQQGAISCLPVSVIKMWARDRNWMYTVGRNGQIGFFDGTRWTRLASGTDVSINDIWGTIDPSTGKPYILAVGSYTFSVGNKPIMHITESNTIDTLPWVENRRPHSVWFITSARIFVSGDGVWMRRPDAVWMEILSAGELPYFTERIRGVATNDVFVVGDFGSVAHWNGAGWRLYPEVAAALYYSCDYRNGVLIAVGQRSARAVVLIGRR